ncbi:MAG: MmcQ/YjbR family DNA-binding protein [Clostridiales bacterium]|nr:MmcQ/YjbR family DNA-binding protein [Clostridiales bacterium]
MNRKEIVDYFLSKPFSIETYPFDEVTPVFKVGGKMFALMSANESDRLSINLKNTPDTNILLKDMYEEVTEAYHMNKTHWVTVYCDRTLSESIIHNLIDESYAIVYKSLTKKLKRELEST